MKVKCEEMTLKSSLKPSDQLPEGAHGLRSFQIPDGESHGDNGSFLNHMQTQTDITQRDT